MNLKTYVLSTLTLMGCLQALAQDKVYKRNGDVVDVKVVDVGPKTISYKKSASSDGPNYTINKIEVDRIEYADGNEDIFEEERRWPPARPGFDRERPRLGIDTKNASKYGNNIVAVFPLHITDNGPGVAFSYERVLDPKRNIASFYFPIAISFNNWNTFGGGNFNSYYFMPGIKFYPTGGKGVVRYGIGANLTFVSNKETITTGMPGSPNVIVYKDRSNFLYGMMVNNSLNINPTPHLHMGLEFGVGFSYNSREDAFGDPYGNSSNVPVGFVQFGYKIGYRF